MRDLKKKNLGLKKITKRKDSKITRITDKVILLGSVTY